MLFNVIVNRGTGHLPDVQTTDIVGLTRYLNGALDGLASGRVQGVTVYRRPDPDPERAALALQGWARDVATKIVATEWIGSRCHD